MEEPRALTSALSGLCVAQMIAMDFESFFAPDAEFSVRLSVEGAHIAAVRGTAKQSRLVISPDMASYQVATDDDLNFFLLVLGHELAHLIFKHTATGNLTDEDRMSLEYWADFAGAKIAIVLSERGPRTHALYRSMYGERPFDPALNSFGRALGKLFQSVYVDRPQYPPKLMRVGLVDSGVQSVLARRMAGVDKQWRLSVSMRLYASQPVKEAMILAPHTADVGEEAIMRLLAWHRRLQGGSSAITLGMKPIIAADIGTSFDLSDEQIAAKRVWLIAQLRAEGHDV